MNTSISQELRTLLLQELEQVYQNYFLDDPKLMDEGGEISSALGGFFLQASGSLGIKNTRVFSYELQKERHVGYLLWSGDVGIYGADLSRFFILLTGFGYISGIEVQVEEAYKYMLWPQLLGEHTGAELVESLRELNEMSEFSAESPMVLAYLEILEQLKSTPARVQ